MEALQDQPRQWQSIAATCLCGTIKHEIKLPADKFPLQAHICHCNSCRHMTGTLCLTLAYWPRNYPPSQGTLDSLHAYAFSDTCTFYFCPTCGTTMLARVLADAADPKSVTSWCAPTGTFSAVDGVVEFKAHMFLQDTLDGGFADFLPAVDGETIPRWPGYKGKGEQLPLPWHAPEVPVQNTTDKGAELLHGHCHCHAINFWISRPTQQSSECRAMWPDSLVPYASTKTLPSDTETWWLRANNTKYFASVCVCTSCRLASGMEWVEFAFIPACNLWADAEGTKPLVFDEIPGIRVYSSSKGVRRYFCGTCGALAFWDGEGRPMVKDVGVGLLAANEGARATEWLEWGCDRVSFAEMGMERAESLTRSLEQGLKEYAKRESGLT